MEIMSRNSQFAITSHHLESIRPGAIIDAEDHKYIDNIPDARRMTKESSVDESECFRVLLIAKEQRKRQSICNALARHLDFDISYLEANRGELALQIIGREKIGLIIFGNDVEDVDILEFLGRLDHQMERVKVPVITILNSGAENTGIHAMKLGAHAYLLNDSEGHHIKLLPILVSRIYAEHQALSEMRQSALVCQTLVDCIPAVIYKLSLQGGRHEVHISPQVSEFGFSADKWGSDAELHHRMCHEEDRAVVKKALEFSYKTGSEFQCEYRIKTSADSLRWFHDQAKVVMDKKGRPLFLQGVMTSITYLKSLEAELARYSHMLDKMVCDRTERLNQRLAILESCNSSLSDNYHKMHKMYLDLWAKYQVPEIGISAGGLA